MAEDLAEQTLAALEHGNCRSAYEKLQSTTFWDGSYYANARAARIQSRASRKLAEAQKRFYATCVRDRH